MPAVPLISMQVPSSACTVGRGTVQKAKWLGGGPAFSMGCWEMGSLHKEFPNKRHQYYLWSHQTAWGTICLWLGHMLSPQVLYEGLVGPPQTHLGPECQRLERSPSSFPLFCLVFLGLSLCRLDNGWNLTGSGCAQGRDIDRE